MADETTTPPPSTPPPAAPRPPEQPSAPDPELENVVEKGRPPRRGKLLP